MGNFLGVIIEIKWVQKDGNIGPAAFPAQVADVGHQNVPAQQPVQPGGNAQQPAPQPAQQLAPQPAQQPAIQPQQIAPQPAQQPVIQPVAQGGPPAANAAPIIPQVLNQPAGENGMPMRHPMAAAPIGLQLHMRSINDQKPRQTGGGKYGHGYTQRGGVLPTV